MKAINVEKLLAQGLTSLSSWKSAWEKSLRLIGNALLSRITSLESPCEEPHYLRLTLIIPASRDVKLYRSFSTPPERASVPAICVSASVFGRSHRPLSPYSVCTDHPSCLGKANVCNWYLEELLNRLFMENLFPIFNWLKHIYDSVFIKKSWFIACCTCLQVAYLFHKN